MCTIGIFPLFLKQFKHLENETAGKWTIYKAPLRITADPLIDQPPPQTPQDVSPLDSVHKICKGGGFVCSSFSSCLICKFRLFIWDLFCLLIQAFMSTTFLASHKFVMLSSCSHLCLSTFYFSFYFIFWRTGCLKMCCLLLWIFQFFLCYWFLILFYCGQRIYCVWYLSF